MESIYNCVILTSCNLRLGTEPLVLWANHSFTAFTAQCCQFNTGNLLPGRMLIEHSDEVILVMLLHCPISRLRVGWKPNYIVLLQWKW